jgi:DNA-binding transcriptional LysR family regulator
VELRHLRYFVAVAEELNFTRAASRLHMATPPLSVQIRKLEAELGAELLSRKGRGIQLTAAGRVFLEQARQTLGHANRAIVCVRKVANGEIGHLSIAYNTVAEFGVFPTIIPAFRAKFPKVHITFHSLRTPQQLQALNQDSVDVGFVCPPIPTDGLDIHELTQQPFIVMMPKDHRLASAPTVSFGDLSDEPLILYSRVMDPDAFRQIEQQFLRAGAVMNVVYELESPLSMINFVAMGHGYCIVPDYARRILTEGVVCKPLGRPGILRSLAIIRKAGNGGLGESFYRFVVDSMAINAGIAGETSPIEIAKV